MNPAIAGVQRNPGPTYLRQRGASDSLASGCTVISSAQGCDELMLRWRGVPAWRLKGRPQGRRIKGIEGEMPWNPLGAPIILPAHKTERLDR